MNKRLGLVYSFILVALLTVPAFTWYYMGEPKSQLYGYTDQLPDRPQITASSFFDKKLQTWTERYVDVHFGLRNELIRSFNEVLFRVFREMPRIRLYATPSAGLYSGMSLEFINNEIIKKSQLEESYATSAAQLRRVQSLLEAQGKEFVVVIAASKPYVYPENLGRRYLAGGEDRLYERTASFGRALQNAGVNVIDSAPMLRAFRHTTNLPTHPTSGVHWNFYAGCLIAKEIMVRARERFSALAPFDCGIPRYDEPQLADVDGLSLMNSWSDMGLKQDTPRPSIVERAPDAWRPAMVFISDSFSDEIIYPLRQGKVYSRLINSGYFKVRELEENGAGLHRTHDIGGNLQDTRRQVLDDIRTSDIVVLQIVDYNLPGKEFGFPEYLLANLGPQISTQQSAPMIAASAPTSMPGALGHLKTLAYVEDGSRVNPFRIPVQTHLAGSVEHVLAAASADRWDVIALLQKAQRRSPMLAHDLSKRGYTVVASDEDGVLALPKSKALSALTTSSLQWSGYGGQANTDASARGSPVVASAKPVDQGFHTQELKLDHPTLVRASFEGTIAGDAPHAAHLSLYGKELIFSLPQGTYTVDQQFYTIIPAQADGTLVRVAFGLGGWKTGKGQLRLNSLEVYPLAPGEAAERGAKVALNGEQAAEQ